MIWFIKTFGRLISAATLLIGLYYTPADVEGWREASEPWKRWLAMIDQNTALWIVVTLCLIYIALMDVRPFVAKLKSSATKGISVDKYVAWVSTYFEVDNENFVKNTAHIVVYNNSKNRMTAKSVRVRTYTVGTPVIAKTRLGADQVDIHHGEQEWFEIGSLVSKTAYGLVSQDCEVTDTDRERASKGIKAGSYSFMIARRHGIGVFSGGVNQDDYTDSNPLSFFVARVSAENLPTLHINFYLDVAKLERKEGQTEIESPILINEIKRP